MDKLTPLTWKETRYKTATIYVKGHIGYIHYNYITNRYEIIIVYGDTLLNKRDMSKVGINVLLNKSDDEIILELKSHNT